MIINIIDENNDLLPGATIVSCDENGVYNSDIDFAIVSDENGKAELPAGAFDHLKISYVGFETQIFKYGSVPSVIQMEVGAEDLDVVEIIAKPDPPKTILPEVKNINPWIIAGIIIIGITALGLGINYLKNQTVKK